eukprot:CAMPEP_0172537696 /NCGR_PEP_ID=MMETSP1067-20121228/9249_1 /TAXON_ID=265564 ORGANISM="Thalassiosira punctigera, Strain Tpunct2005C2" /NCGR_SAMPLE_ID=MMETSP1067 /ASSEMBLY_ACC=CAM_ASM_000444 /LENGTH=606 /DNA_ID=CAMNT_0013323051 /DNA_START=155 /DNA_END=1975 /DNA_ORIENTATION=+
MGATSSSESSVEKNDGASPQSSNYGFSRQEAQHLTALRSLVCQEEQKSERNFISMIWRCSHLLSLNSLLQSPLLSISNELEIEAHLAQHSPSQLAVVQKRCRKLDVLLADFASMIKMNAALKRIFMGNDQFLEIVSNILHGYHQKDSVEFIRNASCNDCEESFSAKGAVELCFQTASVLHYILEEDAFDDTPGLIEQRNVSEEDKMINSLANSLLEYAKNSRDDQRFGGYGGAGASAGVSATSNMLEGSVTKREFSEWQRKVVPDLMYCSVAKFQHVLFFPLKQQAANPFPFLRSSNEITSQTTTKLKAGEIIPISSHVFGKNFMSSAGTTSTTLLSPAVFSFVSISMPKFGQKWYRIFAGAEHGWTFHQLEHSIMGYEGPTLLVIQARSKNKNDGTVTLGAYTASKWEKNKRDFFGTSDCFLFQLQPTMRVLKTLPKMGTRGGHYMFYHSNTNVNTTNPSRKDDLTEGLGFGGTVRHPRLFIDSQLDECRVSHQDTSFEEGYLGFQPTNDPFASNISSGTLHIDSLEIYAVGDEETIRKGFRAQHLHRDVAYSALRNARTVDKAAFLGDMRNGVIESKTFAHRGQVDGRAHGCLKGEEDGKASGL